MISWGLALGFSVGMAALVPGCATTHEETADSQRPADPMTEPESIGSATMDPDGTIVLSLRAEADDGTVGHGVLTYPTDHPQYKKILLHLGGLAPGEVKAVPPFP